MLMSLIFIVVVLLYLLPSYLAFRHESRIKWFILLANLLARVVPPACLLCATGKIKGHSVESLLWPYGAPCYGRGMVPCVSLVFSAWRAKL